MTQHAAARPAPPSPASLGRCNGHCCSEGGGWTGCPPSFKLHLDSGLGVMGTQTHDTVLRSQASALGRPCSRLQLGLQLLFKETPKPQKKRDWSRVPSRVSSQVIDSTRPCLRPRPADLLGCCLLAEARRPVFQRWAGHCPPPGSLPTARPSHSPSRGRASGPFPAPGQP